MYSVLDNPIWQSLTSVDANKNIGNTQIAYLDAEIAPFIGMPSWDEASQHRLLQHAPPERTWFLLYSHEVHFIDEYKIVFSIPLYQFICTKLGKAPALKKGIKIVPLDSAHIDEMIALTALTKPGPFMRRTIEFGNYHGIFENGKLVAMGGERLHLPGLTEISAICTHPDYQGKGYGAKITQFLAKLVMKKGETPFLHARVDNIKAMDVYKRLGFEIRAEIQFYIFRRKDL
ncbi:MAG: GNAT family N-acetyltransferase [Chitinophagaceae bacterium]|nr:GNAT family N-acetyltransferase [Chitinophagaceae bacterium]